MPQFPSQEWCEAVIAALEADPQSAAASRGWKGDVALAVLRELPTLPEDFVVYARPDSGRIRDFRVLEDLEEIEEIEPAYVAQAPLSVWRRLLEDRLDPVDAILKRQVQFQGDLQQIIERVQFKDLLRRALAQVQTTYPPGS